MRSVAQFKAQNLIGSEPCYQAPSSKQVIPDNVAKIVDRLFVRLKAIFPAWQAAFDSKETYQETKRLWLEALVNNGVTTAEQFKRGIAQAERSTKPFLPSVGEFIQWCNSGNPYQHLGLPSAEVLVERYMEYRRSFCETAEAFDWQSAVEYHLVLQLKRAIYDGNLTSEQTLKKAEQLISNMAAFLQKGNEVAPIRTPKLPQETGRKLSHQEKLERIAAIKAILAGVKTNEYGN